MFIIIFEITYFYNYLQISAYYYLKAIYLSPHFKYKTNSI